LLESSWTLGSLKAHWFLMVAGMVAYTNSTYCIAHYAEETEAMRKSKAMAEKALRAGTRALVYGTLIAAAGVTGGAVLTAWWFDIRSQADLQACLQRAAGTTVVRVRTKLAPWKAWCEQVGGGGRGLKWVENSVIVQDLRRKFRVRRRVEPPAATGDVWR
jgi:hypothetical protein